MRVQKRVIEKKYDKMNKIMKYILLGLFSFLVGIGSGEYIYSKVTEIPSEGSLVIYSKSGYEDHIDYLNKLNPKLYEGLNVIKFKDNSIELFYIDYIVSNPFLFGSSHSGVYVIDTKKISIRRSDDFRGTITHEICHHIWYTKLNQDDREAWKTIFKGSDHFVTEYSKENLKEFFAEYCSEYLKNDVILRNKEVDELGFEIMNKTGKLSNMEYFWGESKVRKALLDKHFQEMGVNQTFI